MKLLLSEEEVEYASTAIYAFLGLLAVKFSKQQITALLTPEKIERYLTALDNEEGA
jgi:hypothetical protein